MTFVRSVLMLVLCVPLGRAQSDAHLYSPGTNLERSEVTMLETATVSVDVAMYSFTDREIAEELAKLARKGVRVRVYRDREQFQHETQASDVNTTSILVAAGVEVRVKGARDLMHLKNYAIDGRLLRSGSANWSPTGLKRQDNDVRYEYSPGAAAGFEEKFNEMWNRAGNVTAAPVALSETTVDTLIYRLVSIKAAAAITFSGRQMRGVAADA